MDLRSLEMGGDGGAGHEVAGVWSVMESADGEGVAGGAIGGHGSRWRRVHGGGRRRGIGGVFSLNLTAMIDVVFLLLMYFLLSMDFSRSEEAISSGLPGEGERAESADPFALPVQPIVIGVETVEAAGGGSEDGGGGRYALSVDSPVLADAARGGGGLFFERLAAVRGGVLASDQPIVVVPGDGASWEHAVAVVTGVREAGYEAVRFARPGGGGVVGEDGGS